jgi:ABC-type sugar transport system substrate-binding protein
MEGNKTQSKSIRSKKKKWIIAAALVVVICMLTVVMLTQIRPKEDGVQCLIGVSFPNMTDNFELELYNDINAQCRKYDSVSIVSYDAGESETKQKNDIINLLELGVDALIIVSFEPRNIADTIQNAYDKGIPVILIGYPPGNDAYTTRIYTDNEKIGKMAGEYVAKLSDGHTCTVLEIQGEPHSQISVDRKNGFFEGIAPYKNITKEYVMTGYWSQEKTRARMSQSDFFSKQPPINVIFAHNDMMALGAVVNLSQSSNNAYIISVGGYSVKNSDLLGIKEGMIDATFTYPTGGDIAVMTVMDIMTGKNVPKEIEVPSQLVNIDNVEAFLKSGETP